MKNVTNMCISTGKKWGEMYKSMGIFLSTFLSTGLLVELFPSDICNTKKGILSA